MFCLLSLTLSPFPALAADEEIWTGWTVFESGSDGWYSAGGDGGHAYGRYQFDIGYEFVNFLQYCLNEDAGAYAPFAKYVAMSEITAGRNGNESVMENQPLLDARDELSATWKQICDEQGQDFFDLQTEFAAGIYYYPVKSKLMSIFGINLDDYGPALKGTVWSIAVRDGSNVSRNQTYNNLRAVTSTYVEGIDEDEWLNAIYNMETERHPSQSQRWNVEQRQAALTGADAEEIASGALNLNLGVTYSFDGSEYVDYVEEWIKDNRLGAAWSFVKSGGWNKTNKEWAYTLRGYTLDRNGVPILNEDGVRESTIDFYECYGISGSGMLGLGGGYIDFSTGISGGIWIGDVNVNAETKKIPDNNSNNGIVYYGQSNGAGGGEWAGVRFGGKNIGSSGCSVTSLAMVISYLKGGSDKDEWVYPSDVVQMIANKNGGNYNHFYVAPAGQSHSIMGAVAGYYDLICNPISSGSIAASVAAGKPVIMSCKPGEFTSGGHFIVITGIDEDGYLYVNDPSHPDKSYKKYTASYLASQGKGWWSFSD